MQDKNITGSKEDLQSLFKEYNVDIDEFIKKANGVLKNPLYKAALKKANAPVDEIQSVINNLSGAGVSSGANPNRSLAKKRFNRI